nr:hypothetical protein [uncultured Friedmanniella sp.]
MAFGTAALIRGRPARWLRGLVAAVLLALAALVAGGSPASACSCVYPADAQVLVDQADVVFTGRVVQDRVVGRSRFLTFDVDLVYKGNVAARQRLRTNAQSSACGLSLVAGPERYVVHGRGTAASLTSGLCDGTRPGDRVVGLGPGQAPRPGRDGPSLLSAEVDALPVVVGAALLGASLAAVVLLVRRRRRSARPEG